MHRRPLLIIPPWINKYYILDLKPQNSFVRWVVEQGHTVFIISWVNPDAALASKTFEDYMIEGPLAALDAVGQATGEERVNALGYCIGGTLLACTLAHLAVKYDNRIASATYLTSLVDFEDVGNIEVFIDDDQIRDLERVMAERGYLDGSEMAAAFNTLRANDLIWSFVINNYLLGKDPFPFDILYWNSDSTRLPAAMHSYYLRRMYLDNAAHRAGSPGAGWHADRSILHRDTVLSPVHPGGSHRALEVGLSRNRPLPRQDRLHPGRIRPCRRCRQSAVEEQVRLLDEQQHTRGPASLVRWRQTP